MLIALVRNLPFPDRTPLFYFYFLASAEARVKRSAERWRLAIRDAAISRVEVSEVNGTRLAEIRVDWRFIYLSSPVQTKLL